MSKKQPEDIEQILRDRYPNETAKAIALDIGKSHTTVHKLAKKLGIEKSPEFKQRIQQYRADCAKAARGSQKVMPLEAVRIATGFITRSGNVTRHIMA